MKNRKVSPALLRDAGARLEECARALDGETLNAILANDMSPEVRTRIADVVGMVVVNTVRSSAGDLGKTILRPTIEATVRAHVGSMESDIEAAVRAEVASRWRSEVERAVRLQLESLLGEVRRRIANGDSGRGDA